MKIILASEYFYPVSKGGTEMYVYQLAKELLEHGHDCLVLSLSNELISNEYDGIHIKYIPFEEQAYNDVKHPKNIGPLLDIVNEYAPDVFHLHTYTSSMGINHLLKIKELGIKVFFTSHLPNFTCLRGDLMRYGKEVCDGLLTKEKCMNCYLHSTGIKSNVNRNILTGLSSFNWIRNLIPRLNQYTIKLNTLNEFKHKINNLIVVSKWQRTILALNGFDKNEIDVCRQAIDVDNILEEKNNQFASKLKIGFIGRIVKVKGLHLLLESLSTLDKNTFELHIVAVKSNNEINYYYAMKTLAEQLGAIWIEDLESTEVFDFIDAIDILSIPSIWLETGPIVAFEALARKVPVLAFNYGGVAELMGSKNEFLVDSKEEMNEVLRKLLRGEIDINQKSKSIKFNRSTKDLYNETINLYNKILV